MIEGAHTYDIAVSFSGAQRAYVERVVRACEALGLRVFYDRNETAQLWGNNVIPQLRKVYGGVAARYVIPFLSKDYLAGPYPMDEFYAAMVTAVERGDGYILPLMMDDVVVPREILSPAIAYLRAENYTPEELARIIVDKVGAARQQHRVPRDIGRVMENAVQVRLPRIAPITFSRQDTLNAALARVGQLFEQAATTLEPFALTCEVRTSDTAITVRVEERGSPVCELSLRHGDSSWRGKLTMRFGWPQITGDGINGWIAAEWDADSQRAKLRYDDFNPPMGGSPQSLITADDLFNHLWEKIVSLVEQRTR